MDSPTGNSQLAATTLLTRSQTLGRYAIFESRESVTVDYDGRGFPVPATIFRAEDVDTGTPALLKVFRRKFEPGDPFVRQFLRRGSQAASFEHRNVVTLHEVGLERGLLFAATQPIEGETLREWTLTNGLSAAQTLRLVSPLAKAIDAAHRKGLVHGDIGPESIRIDGHRVPYLTPFGMVRRPRRISVSAAGVTDLAYTSPEQLAGLPLTGAADIYALTAILFYCLTGGESLPRAPVTPLEFGDGEPILTFDWFLPPCLELDGIIACLDLDAVIARGMARQPSQRYPRASKMVNEAGRVLAALPSRAHASVPAFAPFWPEDEWQAAEPTGEATATGGNGGRVAALSSGMLGTYGRRRIFAALAVAFVVILGVVLVGSSSSPVRHTTVVRTAESGQLLIPYTRPWTPVSAPADAAALLANGSQSGVALASGTTTLVAGTLARSAPEPGGVPPLLLARHGAPQSARTAAVAGHLARIYSWTLPGAGHLVAYVLPAARADMVLTCTTSGASDSGLAACERLAAGARVGSLAMVPPGPDQTLATALSQSLAPVSAARSRLDELQEPALRARAPRARDAASREQTAMIRLSRISPLPRNRVALQAFERALSQERAGLATLAAAAADGNRDAYSAARLSVLDASGQVSRSARALAREGFRLPPLPPLYLAGLPAVAVAPSTSTSSSTVTTPSTSASSPASSFSPTTSGAPVTPVAPATQTPSSTSGSNTPSSPTTVVVPTQQSGTGHTSTGPGTVVTVPTGNSGSK